jgi:hypothetical protein
MAQPGARHVDDPLPHPIPVFRVLKQAWRDHVASGTGCEIDVDTQPDQLSTDPTTVSGAVYCDAATPFPVSVTVSLTEGGTVTATQSAAVVPGTGAYTTTFPADTLAAGEVTVDVHSDLPLADATPSSFTVT